jgi:hypothetical protein
MPDQFGFLDTGLGAGIMKAGDESDPGFRQVLGQGMPAGNAGCLRQRAQCGQGFYAGNHDIRIWVLSWRARVRMLSPESLKEMITSVIKALNRLSSLFQKLLG